MNATCRVQVDDPNDSKPAIESGIGRMLEEERINDTVIVDHRSAYGACFMPVRHEAAHSALGIERDHELPPLSVDDEPVAVNKPTKSRRDIRRAASCGLAAGNPASREPQSLLDFVG